MFSRVALLAVACVAAVALLASDAVAAQPRVDLGTADSFAVLAGTTVTNAGFSTLNGDLGVSPGTALTGFPPGIVNGTTHAADPVAAQAQADLTTAYNDAAGRTPPNALPADVGGSTLAPGVYKADPSLGLTGTLTLDGEGDPNAVFVFQIGSALITGVDSRVNLINGAQPSNVFWQVGSSATLGTSSVFAGTILALSSISMNDGVTLNGRALARNGAVTLINDTISAPADTGNCDVESELPQPALGMAVTQETQVNLETCEIVNGPIQTRSADSMPGNASDPDLGSGSGPDALSDGSSTTAAAAANTPSARAAASNSCARWKTDSLVEDNNVAKININRLRTTTNWCWGAGKVRSGSSTYRYDWHRETISTPFGKICNPLGCGWSPHHAFNRRIAGCVGCSSTEVHAHVDFSYRGTFDPTGHLFYNHLNTYPKITGTGRVSCRQLVSFRRRGFPSVGPVKFFRWFHGCSLS